jgi:hypothetical protein
MGSLIKRAFFAFFLSILFAHRFLTDVRRQCRCKSVAWPTARFARQSEATEITRPVHGIESDPPRMTVIGTPNKCLLWAKRIANLIGLAPLAVSSP